MAVRRPFTRPQRTTIIHGMLTFVVVLVILQLWLLTLAFDLFQSGERRDTVGVAILSGLVFLGGLAMLRLLGRRPPGRRR